MSRPQFYSVLEFFFFFFFLKWKMFWLVLVEEFWLGLVFPF